MHQPLSVVKPRGRAAAGPIIQEVTPDFMRRAVAAARRGEPGRYFQVLEHFRSLDDEIPGALQSLVTAVTGDDITSRPDEDTDEAKRQAAVLDASFDEMDVPQLAEHLLEARYFGLRAAEPVWDTLTVDGKTYQVPVTYEVIPQSWIYAAREHSGDDHTTLYIGDQPYHAYEPGSILLLTDHKLPTGSSIDFTLFGCGAACTRLGCFRYFGVEDWGAFNEVFGMPLVLGVLLKGYSHDDRKMLEAAVFGLSSDARAIISEKTRLEFPEVERVSSAETFERFREDLGRGISRLIKSETMTDRSSKYGSNAAMTTTNGVRLDVAGSLARKLRRLLQRRLVGPILDRNFSTAGAPRRLASAEVPISEVQDLVSEARVDRELHTMGFPLSLSEMSERYNRRPAEDEDRLPAAGGGVNPFGGV